MGLHGLCRAPETAESGFPMSASNRYLFWCGSSAAEHSADNRKAGGSTPPRTTSITGYGKVWSILPPLEGGGAGSNPATLTFEKAATRRPGLRRRAKRRSFRDGEARRLETLRGP